MPLPLRLRSRLLLLLSIFVYADGNALSPTHRPSCPTFLHPPPSPSSTSRAPHCPQIWCSTATHSGNYSLVTIKNNKNDSNRSLFALLDHTSGGGNCSLLLSPYFLHLNPPSSNDSFRDVAHLLRTFDLSGSSLRVSDASCANLSALFNHFSHAGGRKCSLASNSAAHLTQLARAHKLLQDPVSLFQGCREKHKPASSYPASLAWTFFDNVTRRCPAEVVGEVIRFLRTGFRIEWDASLADRSACVISCKAAAGPPIADLSRSRPPATHVVVVIGTFLFVAVCFFALAVSAAAFVRRNAAAAAAAAASSSSDEDPMSAFLRHHGLQLRAPTYTYDQLHASTDGFDPKRKIGDGGFGSVYLAHMAGGRLAAVKRLHRHHHPAAAAKYFCNELLILSSIHHPNLVRLHGYCPDPRALLLVYDYVPNGTLADHLHNHHKKRNDSYAPPSSTTLMPWPVRVDVALQVATALEYLHFSVKPPVVHRDVTSSNIFIDKDMRIKLGDFGLSRLLNPPPPDASAAGGPSSSEHYVCTGPQGTPGYLDPDYHRSFRLTEKSDVYSFGVVLLELITGMKAVDTSRDKREVGLADMVVSKIQLGHLHKVVDPSVVRQGHGMMATVEAAAELAFRCLAADKDDRPDAKELVEELKRIHGKLQGMVALKPASG